jgi:hypothetical protein
MDLSFESIFESLLRPIVALSAQKFYVAHNWLWFSILIGLVF